MMKKITLLLVLLTVSFGYSQINITFDPAPLEGAWFPNETLATADVVDSPVDNATYGKVGRLITDAGGVSWQNAVLIMTDNTIDITTTKTITADVYNNDGAAIEILGKLTAGVGQPDKEVNGMHPGTGWAQVTWDFTSVSGTGEYARISFFPLRLGDGWVEPAILREVWIDNIAAASGAAVVPTCSDGVKNQDETEIDCGGAICDACPMPPATAAPAPPARNAEDVKSIFSDAYTSILPSWAYNDNGGTSKDTYDTGWCPADTEPFLIGTSDNTNIIDALGCEGIDFQGAQLDLTSFTHLHIDIWTETPTITRSLPIKLSNWNGLDGEQSAIEFSIIHNSGPLDGISLPEPNPGTWISLDLPLDSFTVASNNLDRDNITQIILAGNLGVIYYDNLYFYKGTPLGTEDFNATAFSVYPNPSKSSWTIKNANSVIKSITVFDVLGKSVLSLSPNAIEASVDGSSLKSGLYFAQIKTQTGVASLKLIKK